MRLPRLTVEEKQSLLGPTVVGCLFGAFAVYVVFAFASEYQLQASTAPTFWGTAADASLAFLVCVAGTVGLLGFAPLVIGRLRSRRSGDA
jgi:hypothetical protein